MFMETAQLNVCLPREILEWIDEHPPVSKTGLASQSGKRTAVIVHLVRQAMRGSTRPSASNQHDCQGNGPGEP
jgi:hypothetical protein